ncbi:CPBP family intramembrane metalloprotease [Legionella septentrionalis]|uniref:CPBP family intramembrane metalloprotease n=2 Tax=Legionellaceae TaxID=444 RepID=A0A433JLD8_9GAMM|nr:CPBP family intramembrane metalloprotease [Legionella septentrionalis]RUR10710.1 CPBP family intramembrane metalloprotease [Legionella septentrionalis]RUR16537.1 CPBP family intramembrane metalloprotease [Legionella septentrionalis]
MMINWPFVGVLFVLSIPGILIAVPRLIRFLLKTSSEELKRRISKIAVGQTLLMVFVMSMAGSVLSIPTGLGAKALAMLLSAHPHLDFWQDTALFMFLYTAGGLLVFLVLYYGVVSCFLDATALLQLQKIRAAIGLDGSMLYSVAEEILARWGLLNVCAFFAILFSQQRHAIIICSAIFMQAILYALSQLPLYLAAGCTRDRRFLYSFLLLYGWQGILFGFIFWQFGILATIIAHMLFHAGWWIYDKPESLPENVSCKR